MAAVENMKPVMNIARISRAMNVPRSTIYYLNTSSLTHIF